MFDIISLEEISGSSFFEILRNLVMKCIPDGGAILEILSDYSVWFLSLGVVAGLLLCFFGYRMRRLWTAILFIILGGGGGALLAQRFFLPLAGIAAATAAAAILGGLAGYFLWGIGCFLRPFFAVSISVFAVLAMNGLHVPGLIAGLAAGLITGILTAAFCQVCLTLYTAVFGGLLAGACILECFGRQGWFTLIVGGIFALLGIGVQFFVNWKIPENRKNIKDKAETSAKEAAERLKAVSQIDTAAQSGIPAAQFAAAQEEQKEEGTQISDAPMESDAAGLCPSCGRPYSRRAKFCMYCGQKLQV